MTVQRIIERGLIDSGCMMKGGSERYVIRGIKEDEFARLLQGFLENVVGTD